MLQFWASLTSTFLNLKVDYHCSLWPNRVYPTPWNIPSLSRTTCCACFLYDFGFSTQSVGDTLSFPWALILECTKEKKHWTFSLSELFIQFHVFKYHPLAIKSNFSDQVSFHVCLCMCISIHLTSPCGFLEASLRCPIWTCKHLNFCLHSPQSHCFQYCQFIGMPSLVVQSKILRVFINSSTLSIYYIWVCLLYLQNNTQNLTIFST